jgi:hypothetical protein
MIPAMKDPALWLSSYCACLPGRRRASSVAGQSPRGSCGGDWLSATIEACPARNTAPLIERDVSRRSPGWCPVRRARPPARRCIPRHRRRWRWACLPRSAGCTSTTAFRSRWAVPTARTQAAARDGLPQAPGPARSTQNSPICTTLAGRPGTPAKVHSGSCAPGHPAKLLTWVPAAADRGASRPPRGLPRSDQQLPRCPTVRLA